MTRGRRPNLTLEPSRQLQTQRAFRERKAAHLKHLEDTVKSQADKILQLKKRLGEEDVSIDDDEDALAHAGQDDEFSSNDTASPPHNTNKRRRLKSEQTSPDDVLAKVLYSPPPPPPQSTSPVSTMSPLLASNSAPPSHTCSQCQRLRHQNSELNRLLADADKQLAFYRQQSGTATTSASSGSGFSENPTSPSSPSSPVYNQQYPYTAAPNSAAAAAAAAASYASKAPPPHHPQHARIQWTQPLSPSLQMQYGSGGAAPAQAAYTNSNSTNNNHTRNETSNTYNAHQRYSTAPDSLDDHSSRPTPTPASASATATATFTTNNTPATYHHHHPPPPVQARSSPRCQPSSRQCGPSHPAAAAAPPPVGVQADQDKCCLGLFACDADGRIIV